MRTDSRTGLAGEVGAELRRLTRPPRHELLTLGVNAAMVTAGWFLLPAPLTSWLFDNLHGAVAFATVLLTWALCDVSSTNLIGHDERGAREALETGRWRRFLTVKVVALSLVIGVPCMLLALVLGLAGHHPWVTVAVLPTFLAIPFGVIAVASWLGIGFPFRVRSLARRWARRRDVVGTLRWAALVGLPYLGLSGIVAGILYLAKLLADLVTGYDHTGPPPTDTLVAMSAGVVVESLLLFLVGVAGAVLLARLRRTHLRAFLDDPEAG